MKLGILNGMEDLNERESKYLQYEEGTYADCKIDAYCLMGAEDRWRWYGGDYDNKTNPPCRCEGCKKYGVIRINH
jgi:hypothetical protein